MGFVIESGGVASNKAIVSDTGRLNVASVSENPIQDATDDGDAYTLTSTYSATGGQEVFSLKNDSASQHIHIHSLMVSSQEVSQWNLFKVTSGTAAGTTATVTNLNLTSGKAFASRGTAKGEASVTGSLTGDRLLLFRAPADTPVYIPIFGSIRMEQGDEIALTLVTGTTNTIEAQLVFFFA